MMTEVPLLQIQESRLDTTERLILKHPENSITHNPTLHCFLLLQVWLCGWGNVCAEFHDHSDSFSHFLFYITHLLWRGMRDSLQEKSEIIHLWLLGTVSIFRGKTESRTISVENVRVREWRWNRVRGQWWVERRKVLGFRWTELFLQVSRGGPGPRLLSGHTGLTIHIESEDRMMSEPWGKRIRVSQKLCVCLEISDYWGHMDWKC